MNGPHIDAALALVFLFGVAIGAISLKITQLEARIRCSRCGDKLKALRETTERHETCTCKGDRRVWK